MAFHQEQLATFAVPRNVGAEDVGSDEAEGIKSAGSLRSVSLDFSDDNAPNLSGSRDDKKSMDDYSVLSKTERVFYLVKFKYNRTDIFYIPDTAGFAVKTGDMVIVEADGGEDMGVVEHANITMEQAKEYMGEFAKRRSTELAFLTMVSPQLRTQAEHGYIWEAVHSSIKFAASTERVPRRIKRAASARESHFLRKKEDNETKVKRICQDKVDEHELPMDILYAEIQQCVRQL
jgi:hypothetical protein